MRARYRNLNPRMITAKFTSKCAETGKLLRKGDSIFYDGKAYHEDSVKAQEFLKGNYAAPCNDRFDLDYMLGY